MRPCSLACLLARRSGLVIALVIALALVLPATGCRGPSAVAPAGPAGPTDPATPPSTTPPPPRDDGRLPPTAVPAHYRVALSIDPNQPRFSGVTTIDVDVPQPTYTIVLNARDMTVSRAVVRAGGVELPAVAAPRMASGGVTPEELVLSVPRPLPAGPAVVEIAYDAPFASDLAGLYRVEEQGRWYAYTQFESTDARRAFPSFDEPGFKTPYDVTITAPAGMIALSNSPELPAPAAAAGDAARVHSFATSPPLPSYLVAFAVGDFDVAEGRVDPFPIRVITTKGRAHLAGTALDVAAALVDKLGDYFDMRYPYAKLDLVAVPDFAAGAMENPGLVTFRDVLLLVDPLHATTAARRSQAEVIAHEFAHQWFGDLVTMKWWNDVWLNEGFATWAEAKVVDQWRPSFGATIGQIAGIEHVMDTDALKSARAVREPVRSTSEAMEAFDGITYQKGAAVLRMIESWLGPDVFQRGVQRYVHENAWKNASADDLFKALDFVSTQKVDELASGFLDHPGVPQVLSNYKCTGDTGRLELRQSEWHPLGDPEGSARDKHVWMLPVCVAVDGQKSRNCFTLGADPIVRNPGAHGCPGWVYPNAGQAGYYRFLVEKDKLFALARAGRALDPDRAPGPRLQRLGRRAAGRDRARRAARLPPPVRRRHQPVRRRAGHRRAPRRRAGARRRRRPSGLPEVRGPSARSAQAYPRMVAPLGASGGRRRQRPRATQRPLGDGRARERRDHAGRGRPVRAGMAARPPGRRRRHGRRRRPSRVDRRGRGAPRRAARGRQERGDPGGPRHRHPGHGHVRRPGRAAEGLRPRARRRAEALGLALPLRRSHEPPCGARRALRVGEGELGEDPGQGAQLPRRAAWSTSQERPAPPPIATTRARSSPARRRAWKGSSARSTRRSSPRRSASPCASTAPRTSRSTSRALRAARDGPETVELKRAPAVARSASLLSRPGNDSLAAMLQFGETLESMPSWGVRRF